MYGMPFNVWSGALTQRWATAKASSQWTGNPTLTGEKARTVFTAKEQVLCWGCGGLDHICRLWPCRQVKWLCSFLLRKQTEKSMTENRCEQMHPLCCHCVFFCLFLSFFCFFWELGELSLPRLHRSPLFPVNYRIPVLTHTSSLDLSSLLFSSSLLSTPLLIHPSILRSRATVIFLTVARRLCSH